MRSVAVAMLVLAAGSASARESTICRLYDTNLPRSYLGREMTVEVEGGAVLTSIIRSPQIGTVAADYVPLQDVKGTSVATLLVDEPRQRPMAATVIVRLDGQELRLDNFGRAGGNPLALQHTWMKLRCGDHR